MVYPRKIAWWGFLCGDHVHTVSEVMFEDFPSAEKYRSMVGREIALVDSEASDGRITYKIANSSQLVEDDRQCLKILPLSVVVYLYMIAISSLQNLNFVWPGTTSESRPGRKMADAFC